MQEALAGAVGLAKGFLLEEGVGGVGICKVVLERLGA